MARIDEEDAISVHDLGKASYDATLDRSAEPTPAQAPLMFGTVPSQPVEPTDVAARQVQQPVNAAVARLMNTKTLPLGQFPGFAVQGPGGWSDSALPGDGAAFSVPEVQFSSPEEQQFFRPTRSAPGHEPKDFSSTTA